MTKRRTIEEYVKGIEETITRIHRRIRSRTS